MSRTHTPNHIDYLEFPSADSEALKQSQRFLNAVFGWNYKRWGTTYADSINSGLASGINADQENRPQQPLAIIYTDDLSAMREKIVAAGGKITLDTFSFPGGRRFHFREPGGIEMGVWSDK